MNRFPIFPLVVLFMIIIIPFIYYLFHDQTSQVSSNQTTDVQTEQPVNGESTQSDLGQEEQADHEQQEEQSQEEQENQEQQQQESTNAESQVVWGVDSASYTDENRYQCVKENFGQPTVWGRYLGTKEDVSVGLDQEEVNLLHEKDVQILVIYNHFNDARGYDHGVEEAEQAVSMAEDLGVPDSVALFGDIEPSYPVDADFIQGWYDTITESKYEVGLYGVFNEGSELANAFNSVSQEAKEKTIVWTAYPQEEITTKENAPQFNPQGPEDSMLYGWQYAIESDKCNIDTNLFQSKLSDYLW